MYHLKRALFTRQLLENCDGIALDIGSAEGFVLDALASDGKLQYVALEPDKDLLKLAKDNMKNRHRVDLVCASAFHFPFKENSFRAVTLLEVIEHLQNIEQLPRLINEIMKDQGVLVISTPYKEKIQYVECTECNKTVGLYGHLNSFDERKVQALFNPYFDTIESEHMINPVAIIGPLLRLPFRITYSLNKMANKVFGKRGYWLITKLKPSYKHAT